MDKWARPVQRVLRVSKGPTGPTGPAGSSTTSVDPWLRASDLAIVCNLTAKDKEYGTRRGIGPAWVQLCAAKCIGCDSWHNFTTYPRTVRMILWAPDHTNRGQVDVALSAAATTQLRFSSPVTMQGVDLLTNCWCLTVTDMTGDNTGHYFEYFYNNGGFAPHPPLPTLMSSIAILVGGGISDDYGAPGSYTMGGGNTIPPLTPRFISL